MYVKPATATCTACASTIHFRGQLESHAATLDATRAFARLRTDVEASWSGLNLAAQAPGRENLQASGAAEAAQNACALRAAVNTIKVVDLIARTSRAPHGLAPAWRWA